MRSGQTPDVISDKKSALSRANNIVIFEPQKLYVADICIRLSLTKIFYQVNRFNTNKLIRLDKLQRMVIRKARILLELTTDVFGSAMLITI